MDANYMAQLQARRSRALRTMGIGAIWLVGGLAVTAYTYFSSSHGGTYFVAWGAMAIGVIRIAMGAFAYFSAR